MRSLIEGTKRYLYRAVIACAVLGVIGYGFASVTTGEGGEGALVGGVIGLYLAAVWDSHYRSSRSRHSAESSSYVAGSGFFGGDSGGGFGDGGGGGDGGGSC